MPNDKNFGTLSPVFYQVLVTKLVWSKGRSSFEAYLVLLNLGQKSLCFF